MTQAKEHFGPFRLHEIFTQLPSALLLTDADGVLLAWNDRAAGLLDGVLQQGEQLVAFDAAGWRYNLNEAYAQLVGYALKTAISRMQFRLQQCRACLHHCQEGR